ncbi:aldehyde reductase I [Calycina marina]|uniref:Aldehyde reductase I n=1 Tax=Calycina marina TaxID=1763456 RepID=A0A9P8CIG0_9HELO|nr:aldehyde reductase I [Calycina marina]
MSPSTAKAAVTGPILTLNNGVRMPSLGFGTFASQGSEGETHRAVVCALNAGYRHLDCAAFYQNEGEVGTGIKEFLAANPSVSRSDIFICTKVWNHLHQPEDVEYSLQQSLKLLQVDHVDAFLVHWPIASKRNKDYSPMIGADGKYVIDDELTQNPEPTWRAMESAYSRGLTRSIGVSNFTAADMTKVLSFAKVAPTMNQIEIHPFLPQDALIAFCIAHKIVPVAYSPLGSQDQVPGTGEKVSTNQELNRVAEAKGASLAQVLIAWGLKRGYVVLPKSSNPGRIESNVQLVQLTEEEFEAVNKVAKGRWTRFVNMKDTFGFDVWPEEA